MEKSDEFNRILTIEDHNKVKKSIGKCSHLLVREVFSMKSKRLLILLAPLALGVNAETLPENVPNSIPEQEIAPNTESQVSQTQISSDASAEAAVVAGAQAQNVSQQSVTAETVPTEVSSMQSVPQVTNIPLPETTNEVDLVNRLFDKGTQDSIQVDKVASDSATSTADAQPTRSGTPMQSQTALQTKPGTPIQPQTVSQMTLAATSAISDEPAAPPATSQTTPVASEPVVPGAPTTPLGRLKRRLEQLFNLKLCLK